MSREHRKQVMQKSRENFHEILIDFADTKYQTHPVLQKRNAKFLHLNFF